jgi:hypothetical protein
MGHLSGLAYPLDWPRGRAGHLEILSDWFYPVAHSEHTLMWSQRNLFARLTGSFGRRDSGVEGRFSFRIRLNLWFGLLSTAIGKTGRPGRINSSDCGRLSAEYCFVLPLARLAQSLHVVQCQSRRLAAFDSGAA